MTTPVTRRGTPPPSTRELPKWIDWLVLAIVLIVSLASIGYTLASGAFQVSLFDDTLLSWHLVRAAGMASYALLTASMLWGLFLASRVIKDWSPGPLSLLLHATTSWLAIVLAAAHAGLLLFDKFYTYTLPDILVPFSGPYRPLYVGLGVISFWLLLAVTLSFSVRKLIGQRAWRWLHYTSYGAFVLITFHALLAGTDGVQPGMRIILGAFGIGVAGLFTIRVMRVISERRAKNAHRPTYE